jgi:hypothetical protein
VHSLFPDSLGEVGVSVVIRVAKDEDPAGQPSLIQDTGDDVAIVADDDVAHRARAFRGDRRAESIGELDVLITAAAGGGDTGAAMEAREASHYRQEDYWAAGDGRQAAGADSLVILREAKDLVRIRAQDPFGATRLRMTPFPPAAGRPSPVADQNAAPAVKYTCAVGRLKKVRLSVGAATPMRKR